MPDFTYKFDVESDNGLSIEGVAGSFDLTWEQGDTSVGEASGPILTACEFVSFMFGALKIDRYLLVDILSETEVQAAELRRKKAELRKTMFADHEESIQRLSLTSHEDGALVEPPTTPMT